ncbi:MAG: hypothetical protein IJZ30_07000 [Alphaproteobacteria bacterium]|nr:hypothetical protein [Alphaproteobacteria bacterium]
MKEKLSVWKVYRNAYRYVSEHLLAFFFLTIFYFLGSLLPLMFGSSALYLVSAIYIYLFFYFATGCYYKHQILLDKKVFIASSLRFISAIGLFLVALLGATIAINCFIYFAKSVAISENILNTLFNNSLGIILKYICIFLLFNVFFIIPSFSFVSEITGKNRSLLMAYAKTKGNILHITFVTAISLILLIITMFLLTYVNVFIASFARAMILVFMSILYFKMYDFFYSYLVSKSKNIKSDEIVTLKKLKIEGKRSKKDVDER